MFIFQNVLTEIEWVPEGKVTLFTADGLVQIGGSLVPRRVSSSEVCHILFYFLGSGKSFFYSCTLAESFSSTDPAIPQPFSLWTTLFTLICEKLGRKCSYFLSHDYLKNVFLTTM